MNWKVETIPLSVFRDVDWTILNGYRVDKPTMLVCEIEEIAWTQFVALSPLNTRFWGNTLHNCFLERVDKWTSAARQNKEMLATLRAILRDNQIGLSEGGATYLGGVVSSLIRESNYSFEEEREDRCLTFCSPTESSTKVLDYFQSLAMEVQPYAHLPDDTPVSHTASSKERVDALFHPIWQADTGLTRKAQLSAYHSSLVEMIDAEWQMFGHLEQTSQYLHPPISFQLIDVRSPGYPERIIRTSAEMGLYIKRAEYFAICGWPNLYDRIEGAISGIEQSIGYGNLYDNEELQPLIKALKASQKKISTKYPKVAAFD